MDAMLKLLSQAGLLLLCINVILYITGFSKHGKAYTFFTLYLLGVCIVQIIMDFFASRYYNNHFLSTYYLFIQFILLSLFFHGLFKPISKKKAHAIAVLSSIITIGFVLQYALYPQTYYNFNSAGFLITSVVLVIYSVLYLYELLTKKLVFYYVTVGILLYLISSALIFASAAAIVTLHDSLYMYIWKTNAGLFIVYQLLITWEWKQRFLPKLTGQRS